MSTPKSLEHMNATLFGESPCRHIIELCILRSDHPGFSRWALNVMISVLTGDKRGNHTEERVTEA